MSEIWAAAIIFARLQQRCWLELPSVQSANGIRKWQACVQMRSFPWGRAASSPFLRPQGRAIAAQVVSGIGFLGAGIILREGSNLF